MKKSSLVVALLLSKALFASDVVYTNEVKTVSLSPTSGVIGKVLPTSKVEILEKSGDKVKVKVEGYVKEGRENAIYFVPKKRILVAALKKGSGYKLNTISKDGDWKKVSLEVYIKDGGFEKEIKPLYKKADKLFSDNCGLCHALHPTTEFTANQWPSMIKAMKSRTPLTKNQVFLVTQYLQKHASDMKGE